MTVSAPAASALVRSPLVRTPPSAMIGTSNSVGRGRRSPAGRSAAARPRRPRCASCRPRRPNADLDRVRAGLDQVARALGRRHVARDQLDGREASLTRRVASHRVLGVPVRDVDHQHVDAGRDQRLRRAPGSRRRRRWPRPTSSRPWLSRAAFGMLGQPQHVARGDQPAQMARRRRPAAAFPGDARAGCAAPAPVASRPAR